MTRWTNRDCLKCSVSFLAYQRQVRCVPCQTSYENEVARAGYATKRALGNRFSKESPWKKHGFSQMSEHRIWVGIKDRCLNSKAIAFKDYGGRGITICDRWVDSFENFYADMGARPSMHHSIDRRDNDGNYEPGNCRWATRKEQANNVRRNRVVEFNGESMSLANAWRLSGTNIQYSTISLRIRKGLNFNEAINIPVGEMRR